MTIEDDLKPSLKLKSIAADLFSTVSPTAVGLKQEPAKKRKYSKKRTVTQAERFQIGKLLEENLTKKDDNGLISYQNNMTDHKIGQLIGPHISYDTVRKMRQEIFGILRKPMQGKVSDTLARITKLEEMFNKLAEEIGSTLRI